MTHDDPRSVSTVPGLIRLCGVLMTLLVFGFVLSGVLREAPHMLREGVHGFLPDAVMRLAFGGAVGLISALPYVILAGASRRSTAPHFHVAASLVMLFVQLWLMVDALFLARSSTAGIAVLFIPFYLCAPAAAIWGGETLVRRIRRARSIE